MTDKYRLIELLSATHTETDNYKEQARLHDEYIADYLLANGVIVPPCKVGDSVWFIADNEIFMDMVEEISIYQYSETSLSYKFQSRFNGVLLHRIPFDAIGKYVFLTKEEAEERLKKINEMSHI